MPSTYALLPGAYRIELGEQGLAQHAAFATPAGSFAAHGYLGIANTSVKDTTPTAVTITSGDAVRRYSQYNETSYADFAIANASAFGGLRPRLERDAQSIQIDFGQATGELLDFDGQALMQGAEGGSSGNLFLSAANAIEVKAGGAEASEGFVALDADDISAFGAGTLTVGGIFTLLNATSSSDLGSIPLGPRIVFQSNPGRFPPSDVVIRSGAELSAGQIFLTGKDLKVESGAVLDTTAGPTNGLGSSAGYVFSESYNGAQAGGGAVLTVANGFIDFTAPVNDPDQSNSITVEDGAALRTLGTIGFSTSGPVSLDEAELSARYFALSVPSINIGTAESFAEAEAAGVLGPGVRMSQSTLEKLLRPDRPGLVPIERISLTVGESINLLGDVDFNLRSAGGDASAALVLNTPAIYGWGDSGDVATITTDTLIWNGLSTGIGLPNSPFKSATPGAVTPGGAGTGSGTLAVDARQIVFGYDPLARPQDQIELDRWALGFANVEFNASERITANHRGTLLVYQSGTDAASYAGGALRLSTPLLTGDAGSYMAYKAGGAVTVSAPEGAATADTSKVGALGGEVRLAGQTVTVDTAVALPSGRLVLEGEEGVALTDRADIDLSGRGVQFFDVAQYSWGGDLVMESASGAIAQAAGSTIDVSATNNHAGSIAATATSADGRVDFAGALQGAAATGFDSGAIDIRAGTLDDFAGLNQKLNTGGFFDARRFVIKRGDLTVGDEVRANKVTISVDDGSLTVDGRIDASGADVGTIRLAARDDLVLTGNAVLDAHGTRLATDSYAQAIEASNRGEIELTAADGTVDLASGARIDLRSADGVARGRLDINAPRVGGDDVAVNAADGLTVDGAASIAVNAFARYSPADGVIDQDYLDLIHGDSAAFIDAANANGAVDARLSGLKAYGDAFHLRPGVEIRSATPDGDLTVQGDLDLSGYRYGPEVDGAIRGSGEPGVITFRAGGDLNVNGSINDGFAPPPATPDDNGWFSRQDILRGGVPAATDITIELPFNPTYFDTIYYFPNFATPVVESGSVSDGFATYLPGDTIPGYLYGTVTIAAGTVLSSPTGNNSDADIAFDVARAGKIWAVAPMLAPGVSSWSMRLVGGADLDSADSRTVQAKSLLGERGDVLLEDTHKGGPAFDQLMTSVIRTGTGYLDVLAGGDYRQTSLFGVYTAGTQVGGTEAWDESRPLSADGSGSVLGFGYEGYEATLNAQRMYFTRGGGDLLLSAQGDVRGFNAVSAFGAFNSNNVGNWLWRQGGEQISQLTAWGINFGQYRSNSTPQFVGFSGMGVLGGGDLTVIAGGDAGSDRDVFAAGLGGDYTNQALDLVVGGSGLVDADGRLRQTGGGSLSLKVGGRLNTGVDDNAPYRFSGGQVVNVRGGIEIAAGSIGQTLETAYGNKLASDPRAIDTKTPLNRHAYTPLAVTVGDGMANLRSRGDLNVVTGQDAGRAPLRGGETQADDGIQPGAAVTSFTLWTDNSGIDLFAAGGDIHQTMAGEPASDVRYDAGRFNATAAGGSISLDGLLLGPSANGDLGLFARDHLFGTASLSGGSVENLATPFRPLWTLGFLSPGFLSVFASNAYTLNPNIAGGLYEHGYLGATLFVFGRDTATDLHAGETDPMRLYAVDGDIVMRTGGTRRFTSGGVLTEVSYTAAKPVVMRAGRDILASGLILNNDPNDVSIVEAGRDVLNTTLAIAGPGVLEVNAGRNVYQALTGDAAAGDVDSAINSIGAIVEGDARAGASVVLTAGMGGMRPDYAAFASLYFDAANLADPERPLAEQSGKVAKTYEKELAAWLRERFGYEGGIDGALAYFRTLPSEQQGVFVRGVYFEELRLSGREHNDPDSLRSGSYLRGRNAIAALLPERDAQGRDIAYDGSITLQGSAGVHTDFGGDIQVLAPGGGLTLGADGVAPPASTGLVTQGSGNIETYTQGSVLLGLSRIMTTFGGGITSWSAEGDINAGRGAKTTVLYTPPKLTYDDLGNVALAPTAPSSGAGIATLNPIPEVEPGDVDLIAPLGTIDAGEAGIRVSGNVNLAALQVVNAANIQVKGEATGIPVTATVNTAALASASAAANSATQAVQDMTRRQQDEARRNLPSIISVQVLGFGDNKSGFIETRGRGGETAARDNAYDPASAFQVLGNGELSEAQQSRLTAEERRRLSEQR